MNAVQQHTQNGIMSWDEKKIQLFKDTICKGASNEEFELALEVCRVTGLNPFARQIYFVKRWDSQLGREVMTPQASIDGFRLVAQRTGKYAGQKGPYWCGADGEWKDVWLSDEPPHAAKVGVMHHEFQEPLWRVAKFTTYKQVKKDGKLASFWAKGPELMLAKCSEALALRSAFPQELSGLYTQDEMSQASVEQETPEKDITSEVKQFQKEAPKDAIKEHVDALAGKTDIKNAQLVWEREKARLNSIPKDVADFFRWKETTKKQIFEILDANNEDFEAVRGYMADNGWKGSAALSEVAASDKMPDDAAAF